MRFLITILLFLLLLPCSIFAEQSLNIIPWPQSIATNSGDLSISSSSRIVAGNPSLLPLAAIVSNELSLLFDLNLHVVQNAPAPGDLSLVFSVNPSITGEMYRLTVDSNVTIEAQNYNAIAMGTVTFLQSLNKNASTFSIPKMIVDDYPAKGYRSLSADIKNQWHPVSTLKDFIVICRWYKIRYLSLHTGERQWMAAVCNSTTNLSKAERTSQRLYTPAEMKEVIDFGAVRGVTLVPHNESIPTMAAIGVITNFMPEVIGTAFTDTCIYSASPQYWAAMRELTARACLQFADSPFYHVGPINGEVAGFGGTPEEQAFMAEKGMRNSGDYYRWLALEMMSIGTNYGKTLQSWEGVYRDTASPFQLPAAYIMFMQYTHGYYNPQTMVNDGYNTVNCGWTPLYIVGDKSYPVSMIYDWDCYKFGPECPYPGDTFGGYITVSANQQNVLGGQLCSWETPQAFHTALLRSHIPALSERVWHPGSGLSLSNFIERWHYTDSILPSLFTPPDAIDVSGYIANPNAEVGSGNLANLVGDATFGWQMNVCGIPVLLNGFTFSIDSGGGNPMNYLGVISGNGTVRIVGAAAWTANHSVPVVLSGSNPMLFSGDTILQIGFLALSKSPEITAVPGRLILGGNSAGDNLGDTVIWAADHQINDSSEIVMQGSQACWLDLNGHAETAGSLSMSAAAGIKTGDGGSLLVASLVREGVNIPNGIYTSAESWIEGSGSLIVGSSDVPPGTPVGVQASDGAFTNKIEISWPSVYYASSYRLFRSLNDSTDSLVNISGTISSPGFIDSAVVLGTTYYYRVQAGNEHGWSSLSSPDTGYISVLPAPANVMASQAAFDDKIAVSWDPVPGASLYQVFRALSNSVDAASPFSPEINSTSFDDTNALIDLHYFYWVKAGFNGDWSGFSLSAEGYLKNNGPWFDITGEIVNPNSVVPAGYTARCVGSAFFGWQTGSCAIDVDLNGYQFGLDNGNGNPLDYSGSISGNGDVWFKGAQAWTGSTQPVTLSGSSPNTFVGPSSITYGILELNKIPGVIAIPGDISVGGDSSNVNDNDKIVWAADNQIADTATITMQGDQTSWLVLDGHHESVDGLIIGPNATVDTGSAGSLQVSSLTVDGADKLPGTYTSSEPWIAGSGSVVVVPEPAVISLSMLFCFALRYAEWL